MSMMQERGALRLWVQRGKLLLIGTAMAGFLAACGGGGGSSGTSVFDGGGSASSPASGVATGTAADLVIVLSKSTLANSGSDTLTATVTSIDSNNVTVANVPVTLSADQHAVVTLTGSAATGTDGTLKASVSAGSDTTARTVTVTAKSGSVTRTVTFDVVPSPSTTTPQAAALQLRLDASSVNNSGSVVVNATATAVDINNNALAGIPVQFAVDSNAVIAVGGTQTDASGKVTGAVSIGSDSSNRTITVTAKSGTLTRSAAFKVVGAALNATAVPTVLTASATGNQVNYALVDFNQNPMAGLAINVSGSGLPTATGVTDSNGLFTYTYTAPATPGAYTINASAGGTTATTNVTVSSGSSTVPIQTTVVSSARVAASPNVVAVNSSGTNNVATLTATFLDANNVPIKNIRVRFDHSGDSNSPTAAIGAGTNLIYSDLNGNATSTYIPGANGSPTNGVTITACWDYADFSSGCPHSATTTLTVSSTPLAITLGHGDTITEGSAQLTYIQKFVVLVVDSAGNPKSDVQITPSIDLNGYYKGFWDWGGTTWVEYYNDESTTYIPWGGRTTPTIKAASALCLNEDLNRNGALDSGEDKNNNGVLEPRKSDVSITMVGATKTDSSGTAVLQIEYPKSLAGWVNFTITASAAGVLSPPATHTAILPVEGGALNNQSQSPAFAVSPYGKKRLTTDTTGYCTNSD